MFSRIVLCNDVVLCPFTLQMGACILGHSSCFDHLDKNDWNLNWNSKARFQRIKQLLHASMLQKFPANERQNDSEITRSLPFFESYRNTFIKYVSDLG